VACKKEGNKHPLLGRRVAGKGVVSGVPSADDTNDYLHRATESDGQGHSTTGTLSPETGGEVPKCFSFKKELEVLHKGGKKQQLMCLREQQKKKGDGGGYPRVPKCNKCRGKTTMASLGPPPTDFTSPIIGKSYRLRGILQAKGEAK